MSVEDPKSVISRWVQAWNRQDLDAAGEMIAPEYVRHDANMADIIGPEAELQFIRSALVAFPDLHLDVEQVIAEGDWVVARLQNRGTHRGDFLGVAPTGHPVTFSAMESYRVVDGRLVEQWVVMDVLGLLQQLGAVPAPT